MATQLTLKEVLGKAIQKEIESYHLYRDLSQKMSDEATKDAFQEPARQEQGHQQQRVEFLYVEVAFPQTDGE